MKKNMLFLIISLWPIICYSQSDTLKGNNLELYSLSNGSSSDSILAFLWPNVYKLAQSQFSLDTSNISNFYLKVRTELSAGSGISYNNTTGVITGDQSLQEVTNVGNSTNDSVNFNKNGNIFNIGSNPFFFLDTINKNMFLGTYSSYGVNSGEWNVFLGEYAGSNNLGYDRNTFIGYAAGYNSKGDGLTFIGTDAGYSSTGDNSTLVGFESGLNNSGSDNSFLGWESGYSNTSGFENTFIGSQASYNNTSGFENTSIGYMAGFDNSSGTWNTFIGVEAGTDNTTGIYNVFISPNAGYYNQSGYKNIYIGAGAAQLSTNGHSNVVLGYGASYSLGNSANNDVIIGSQSGAQLQGYYNTIIGDSTAWNTRFGNNNIVLGSISGARSTSDTLNNTSIIGDSIKLAISNVVILGRKNQNIILTNIDSTTSQTGDKLQIDGNLYVLDSVKIPNYDNSNPSTFLTTDGSGNLKLSSIGLGTLNNVTLTSPDSGQLLQFNGSNWLNITPSYLTAAQVTDSINSNKVVIGVDTTFNMTQSQDTVNLAIDTAIIATQKYVLNNANTIEVISVSSNSALSAGSQIVNASASSSSIVITLPSGDYNNGYSYLITIKKTDASANIVTIDPPAGGTIDGASSLVISSQYQAKTLYASNSTTFWTQ